MRADSHDGPEHNTLQAEAGYIDARPYLPDRRKHLLQRLEAEAKSAVHERFAVPPVGIHPPMQGSWETKRDRGVPMDPLGLATHARRSSRQTFADARTSKRAGSTPLGVRRASFPLRA